MPAHGDLSVGTPPAPPPNPREAMPATPFPYRDPDHPAPATPQGAPTERPYRPPSLDGRVTYGVYLRFGPDDDALHAATAATSLIAADRRARERVRELTGRERDPLPFCEAVLVRFDAPATIPGRLSLEALRAGHPGGCLVG